MLALTWSIAVVPGSTTAVCSAWATLPVSGRAGGWRGLAGRGAGGRRLHIVLSGRLHCHTRNTTNTHWLKTCEKLRSSVLNCWFHITDKETTDSCKIILYSLTICAGVKKKHLILTWIFITQFSNNELQSRVNICTNISYVLYVSCNLSNNLQTRWEY